MSNDQPSRRPPARSSGGGAPMGSTISIVVAVVAVIVGFLILRNINNDSDGSDNTATNPTASSTDTGSTAPNTTVASGPSTTAPFKVDGATVVVANAAGVAGAAGQFTTALQAVGFTMGTATDAAAPEQHLEVSKVYYATGDAAAQEVAASVARAMGAPESGVATSPMPSPVPISGEAAGLGGATVLVMLGTDLAGKPLPILAATTPETSTTLPSSPINDSTTSSTTG